MGEPRDDLEQCSFCNRRWTLREYQSVAHCAEHTDKRVSDLRRERDAHATTVDALTSDNLRLRAMVRAATESLGLIADALGEPCAWVEGVEKIRALRRERDEARADLSALRAWVRSLGLTGLPGDHCEPAATDTETPKRGGDE